MRFHTRVPTSLRMWICAVSEMAMTACPSMVRLDDAGCLAGMALVSTTQHLLDDVPEIGCETELKASDGNRAHELLGHREVAFQALPPLAHEGNARDDLGGGEGGGQRLVADAARLHQTEDPTDGELAGVLGAALVPSLEGHPVRAELPVAAGD